MKTKEYKKTSVLKRSVVVKGNSPQADTLHKKNTADGSYLAGRGRGEEVHTQFV